MYYNIVNGNTSISMWHFLYNKKYNFLKYMYSHIGRSVKSW